MHTSDNCTIAGSPQSATFKQSNCYINANDNSGCGSLMDDTTASPNNYGSGFNQNQGGVYATEWTSEYVKHWWFPRGTIPSSITNGAPDVSQFGLPAVDQQGACDIDSHFQNMSIIINIDFCGAWAGNVYSQYSNCPQNTSVSSLDSCVDFVGNNPTQLVEAYFEINSIRVYQMPSGVATTSTYSTSLSSVTFIDGTNTIPKGMGGTTSTGTPPPYTGPISSSTSTSAISMPTGAICPDYNNTIVTNTNGEDYSIACGFDYDGGANLDVYVLSSFQACLDQCDSVSGCREVAYSGNACYAKPNPGSLVADSGTNVGIRVAGLAPSQATSSSVMSSMSPAGSSSSMGSSSVGVSSSSVAGSSSATTSSSMTGSSSSSLAPPEPLSSSTSTSGTTTSSHTSTAASPSSITMMSYSTAPASSSTAMSSSSPATTASAIPLSSASCPSSDGDLVTDDCGVTYILGCGSDTQASANGIYQAVSSFADCFKLCSDGTAGPCSAFTFVSSTKYCYLKSSGSVRFVAGGNPSAGLISGIQPQYLYQGQDTSSPRSTSRSCAVPTSLMSSSSLMWASSSSRSTSSQGVTMGSSRSVGASSSSSITVSSTAMMISSSVFPSRSYGMTSYYTTQVYNKTTLSVSGGVTSSMGVPVGETSLVVSSVEESSSEASAPALTTTSSDTTTSPSATGGTCPTASADICGSSSSQNVCSSSSGSTYSVACGYAYDGAVIDDSLIGRLRNSSNAASNSTLLKRIAAPDFGTCQNYCDTTTDCVAVNYFDGNCTLFSEVTGVHQKAGSIIAAQPASYTPTCPDFGGQIYVDSDDQPYTISCYTYFTGNDVRAPIYEASFTDCLPHCDMLSGCNGVLYDMNARLCYLKRAISGTVQTDFNVIVAAKNVSPAPGVGGGTVTITPTLVIVPTVTKTPSLSDGVTETATVGPTTTLISTLTPGQYMPSGSDNTVTVAPTTTLLSTLPPGGSITTVSNGSQTGSYYIYTTTPSSALQSGGAGGGCTASICFDCCIVPTVVEDCGGSLTSSSGSIVGSDAPTGSGSLITATAGGSGTCRPYIIPGTGTTTVFTTHTITSCGPQSICPNPGYGVIGGSTSYPGATIVTTTNSNGNSITYTAIPTGGQGGSGSSGSGDNGTSGNGSGGSGSGGYGGSGSNNGTLPTCPLADGSSYIDSMGSQYIIQCGILYTDRTLDTKTQPRLTDCMASCDMYNVMNMAASEEDLCLGISWIEGQASDNCLLKAGSTSVKMPETHSARLTKRPTTPGGGGWGSGSGNGGGTVGITSVSGVATATGGGSGGSGGGGSGPGTGKIFDTR